jgi:hypothetical protein
MTDTQALELLQRIAAYAEEYGNGGNPKMTVGELTGDLFDSLPRSTELTSLRERIEPHFGRDSLT